MKPTLFNDTYRIKSTRIPGWDYATPYGYFITICTHDRKLSLGKLINGKIKSPEKDICLDTWNNLPIHYPNCEVGSFVVMPNHIHGILNLFELEKTGHRPVSTTKTFSVSEIIRGFKTFTAKSINALHKNPGQPFWQTRFYEHVIRDDHDQERIEEFIYNNPMKWHLDKENPNHKGKRN